MNCTNEDNGIFSHRQATSLKNSEVFSDRVNSSDIWFDRSHLKFGQLTQIHTKY